ncbi:Holliday junction branch migration protein RuvA [Gorillibacterium massiliense]|uniref:Holliday junction branch migration protein RuvA n=1 Tax=Gorillibacterium massiliense TaxID=1280390 RepID=UPI0004BB9FA9|nr:Holliday junction branch migration protein RuvA [Gorillibacterium massiliense]
MIDYLKGILAHRENDYVVIDVNGVGYRVFCSNPYGLTTDEGSKLTMYIHYHVREDAILLFGFPTREEQSLFRRLLDVSGVGPRVALGILSAGRPDAIVSAIYQEDIVFLTRLPGIGKKTAQRIVLDLKDKLSDLSVGGLDTLLASAPQAAASGAPASAPWTEAKMALMALGYTEAEVDRIRPAVQKLAEGSESTDALIKLALKAMMQG